MDLVIDPHGQVRCVYDETIDLATLGKLSIRRASYVEPNADGGWMADLSPLRGPRLAGFVHRSQALEAELVWLKRNWLAWPPT